LLVSSRIRAGASTIGWAVVFIDCTHCATMIENDEGADPHAQIGAQAYWQYPQHGRQAAHADSDRIQAEEEPRKGGAP
jgi:hypothetical protein